MPIENYGIASRQSKCLCKLMDLWRHYRRRNNFFGKEKYNMFKKILSTMLCIAITANLITANVFAMENTWENTQENEEIIKALQLIEPIKENYGLTDADLENMKVGEPIKTYEYTNTGFSFIGNYIPLICDDRLTAWAVEINLENKVIYQISTAYINEIIEAVDRTAQFALIYDKNNCYLFDGIYLHKLGSFETVTGRSNLTKNALNASNVELNSLNKIYDLRYTHESVQYGLVLPEETYKCNVNYVNQIGYGYKSLCWAATIACIVNYIKGSNFTALTMAQANMSADNLNLDDGLEKGREEAILKKYGLSYTYREASVPSINIIKNNINNNMPLFSSFKHSTGRHACTIYGCSISNQDSKYNCIYVMDPEFGSATAFYDSGTYKYKSSYSGVNLALDYTTRRY